MIRTREQSVKLGEKTLAAAAIVIMYQYWLYISFIIRHHTRPMDVGEAGPPGGMKLTSGWVLNRRIASCM